MGLRSATFNVDDLVRLYSQPSLYSVLPGNKVMLKSGGPEMTVCDSTGTAPDGTATCSWLDAEDKLQTYEFKLVCLTCYGAR